MNENLRKANKDVKWVEKVLQQYGAQVRDTWLLTVDSADHILFYRKES